MKAGVLLPVCSIDTKDGVYDCSWSESTEGQLGFVMGDGTLKLWDTKSNKIIREYKEHQAEAYCIDWNMVNRETIITGSWDHSLKLWHPDVSKSIRTFEEHTGCVYGVAWHPRYADMFSSVSGDLTCKLWYIFNLIVSSCWIAPS